MNTQIHSAFVDSPKRRITRLLLMVTGIILGQIAIYGPCLLGRKILLPLDILAQPYVYIPRTPELSKVQQWDPTLCDMVFAFEPARRFAARELRAGRLPLWSPDYFAGVPCIWSIFSPFELLECLTESPVIVAWKALAIALVGGAGMYRFCRRAVRVGFWPACVCAWCYPLTGFFVIWQGFVPQTVCILPWLLLAVDGTVRRTSRFATIGLSLATGLVAWGQLDIAGQVLLISGLYAMWCLWDVYGLKCFSASARRKVGGLALGWTLGLMLAAPQILPIVEYAQTGSRISRRVRGREERPPAGLVAVPHIFLPDYYGRTTRESLAMVPYIPGNLQESAVGAYAGVLGMLFAAPLSFWSRRHRSMNLCLLGLGFLGVSWVLNVPIIVSVLRLPGMNVMSHNRLVFASSFACLALAAVGFEVLVHGIGPTKRWCWLLALPPAVLSALCICRAIDLPEPLASEAGRCLALGLKVQWLASLDDLSRVQQWFYYHSLISGVICAVAALLWFLLGLSKVWLQRCFFLSTAVLFAELLWFAQGRQSQCDLALYYPPVPALQAITHARPGRVIGFGCLPANLASMAGLRDIRGYNGVEPAELLELLTPTIDPKSQTMSYSRVQNMAPRITPFPSGDIRLSRILDLLEVRYVIFRGEPPPGFRPIFRSFDYFVLQNTNALARAFVPQHVKVVPDREARLAKLQSLDFDPRQTAFVESPIELPDECRGQVEIRDEIPTRVTVKAEMDTAGLVVLADQWDKGWRVYVDGRCAPILRTDHTLRGVSVPAGSHLLEFRYESESFTWGLRLAGVAILTLMVWMAMIARVRRQMSGALAVHGFD